MRLIGKDKLDDFKKQHADARKRVDLWVYDVIAARWKTSQDIKLRHASASFLSENVVIFNVGGNSYRLETAVVYATDDYDGIVNVKWIGTHAEYSKRTYQ